MRKLPCLKVSRSDYPLMQFHIPEQNPWWHFCKKLKIHTVLLAFLKNPCISKPTINNYPPPHTHIHTHTHCHRPMLTHFYPPTPYPTFLSFNSPAFICQHLKCSAWLAHQLNHIILRCSPHLCAFINTILTTFFCDDVCSLSLKCTDQASLLHSTDYIITPDSKHHCTVKDS